MKLPHRRQFLHLAAAAAALPAPPDADTKTPPGWAPRAESRGNPRVPLRSEGSAWETHGARSFSLLPPPAFGEGSYRRLTRLGIAGRWRSSCACQRPHPRRWQVRSALSETDCVAGVTGKPRHGPQRPDCVAGLGGLELRNVDANYLFERSHRFAGIQPNSGYRDCSRLSCGVRDTQLG